MVSKQNQQISHLQLENIELCNRSMKSNVLIHNIPKKGSEDCGSTIATMLKDTGMPNREAITLMQLTHYEQLYPFLELSFR